MNATLFSLIAVTVGFSALVAWVYWPSRRRKIEALGRIPLDDGSAATAGTRHDNQEEAESKHE